MYDENSQYDSFLGARGRHGGLNNPNEAAYVAIAMKLLPAGLPGLLVCGIRPANHPHDPFVLSTGSKKAE